ncbi:MAG TPA: AAA family ATPase [Myxococcota bacterium]|nr:AAA family ATPase [Myxococcota bacterium]
MYESFFSLREPAFSLTPDPRFLWPSETHQEGFAALYYGITRRKGFLLLTGDVGTGKTTLLRAVLSEIPTEIEVALLMNTADLDSIDLFKLIAAELRLDGTFTSRADYLIALNRFLLTRLERGLNTVLVIDEAQNLDRRLLEQVRLLSNLETASEKLLQIVLTGQPELRDVLASPELAPLRQRIALEHHVQRLRPEEIAPYLQHRIEVAGARYEDLFAPGCEEIFYGFSAGCPRLLNLLADRALLAGFSRQERPVRSALLERKAKEMAEQQARSPLDPRRT